MWGYVSSLNTPISGGESLGESTGWNEITFEVASNDDDDGDVLLPCD